MPAPFDFTQVTQQVLAAFKGSFVSVLDTAQPGFMQGGKGPEDRRCRVDMWNPEASRIGTEFLQRVDDYLGSNLRILSGHDMWSFYWQFFNDLKCFKGNANGFTGLSEYLIFRFLYHLLGGSFGCERVPASRDLFWFRSIADPALVIGQGTRLTIAGKRRHPDIALFHSDRLLAVCSIKLWLTNGLRTAVEEFESLRKLKALHSEMRALLVVFSLSEQGEARAELTRMAAANEWFEVLVLRGTEEPLHLALRAALDLDRVVPVVR
jgi:hypothetical protein